MTWIKIITNLKELQEFNSNYSPGDTSVIQDWFFDWIFDETILKKNFKLFRKGYLAYITFSILTEHGSGYTHSFEHRSKARSLLDINLFYWEDRASKNCKRKLREYLYLVGAHFYRGHTS